MAAISAMTVLAAAAAAGTAYSIYAGERAASQAADARKQQEAYQRQALTQQQTAQQEAKVTAEKQAKTSEETMNAATRKNPDVSSIMAAAEATQQGGLGSTMLTGATGIDPNDLKLNKSTLLGA
jgi:Na+-translocating ferredoxin:NAD+ oxidoreductase RnfG subunit